MTHGRLSVAGHWRCRILRREISAADAARTHDVPAELIEGWTRQFLLDAEAALSRPGNPSVPSWSRPWTEPGVAVGAAGVAAIWLALRVAYWNGFYIEDSPGYVTDAILTTVHGLGARENVNGMNIGTYLPVALPIALFGKSEVALSLWPLLCSLLGMTSIGVLCGILFGRTYGLFAALLYATYPGDVFFSTVVMPDAIQAGWLSFAMLLAVLAFTGPADRKNERLWWGGAAMGMCHLVRAGDVLLLPVGAAATALMSAGLSGNTPIPALRDSFRFVAGWAVILALEGLLYLVLSGDVLLRFHVVLGHYGSLDSIRRWGLNHDPLTIPYSLFAPLLWNKIGGWGRLNQDQAYHGLLFCWALAALAAGLVATAVARHRIQRRAGIGLLIALVWLAWPLLYHQYGSQSLTTFVPIHRLPRQLVVYAPGAIVAIVAGCFLAGQVVSRWHSQAARRLVRVAAVAVAALHLSINWQGERIAYGSYHEIKNTYVRIRDHLPAGTTAIVADPGDLAFFDFWLNPPGVEQITLGRFQNVSGCAEIENAVVLTHANPGWRFGAQAIQSAVAKLPCLVRPPAHWRLLYDGYPEKAYQVGPPL